MEKIKSKTYMLLTSILCLLPLVFSAAILHKLPARVPIHWNIYGEVDSYGNTILVAFGLPLFFFAINILVNVIVSNDPSNQRQATIVKTVVSYLLSLASIILVPSVLLYSLGYSISILDISVIIISIMLILIGNYLPKTRLNYSIGIRLPWTLSDSENWRKTHRFTGFLWAIAGYILLQADLFFALIYKNDPIKTILLIIVIIITVLCPIIYSFLIYKKKA